MKEDVSNLIIDEHEKRDWLYTLVIDIPGCNIAWIAVCDNVTCYRGPRVP